jgi:hypothetical protein
LKARAIPLGAVFAIALTTGCQTPPRSHSSEATRTTHALRQEPLRAAACIARNVDRYRSPYSARIGPAEPPAVAEVIVGAREIVSVVRLFAAGGASTALVWTTPEPVYGRDELIAAMMEGC